MDWTLALSFTFVMSMLALRYQLAKDHAKVSPQPKPKWSDRGKLAKVLVMALLGFAVISYNLQTLSASIDGKAPGPSMIERMIRFFASL